jgi:hypothetical protein
VVIFPCGDKTGRRCGKEKDMLSRILRGQDIMAREIRYYVIPMLGIALVSLICMATITALLSK